MQREAISAWQNLPDSAGADELLQAFARSAALLYPNAAAQVTRYADRAAQAYALIGDTASRDGLDLNLDDIARTPSTLDAHRLVQFAEEKHADPAVMVEAIFAGYFQHSRDIGDIDVLVEIAAEQWLDADEARTFLKSERDRKSVRIADAAARKIGIQAVPCFVFDKRYAISGAQEPMAFYPLLDLAGTDDVASPIFNS